MNCAFRIASFGLCAALAAGQKPARDLTYEENPPPNAAVSVPRGYALIVGIANYQNLPSKSHSNSRSAMRTRCIRS